MVDTLRAAVLGLVPVLSFLAALVLLDSYKLVRIRLVVAVVAVGAIAGGLAYAANGWLLDRLPMGFEAFSRYVAPPLEELLKAFVVVALVRMHRVGFLVDAAILGFAAGAGFALFENLHYLDVAGGAGLGTWLVRGFGTAIMHGGATSLLAVIFLALLERRVPGWKALLPGFALAVALHSLFNHFVLSPLASAIGIAIAFPILMSTVFARSEAALGDWLGKGFDADAEMLALIESGRISQSRIGHYLATLRSKFEGPVLVDLLCYLKLHTELALRAKGILMMRETGFDVPIDEATREKFAELRYLEASVGRTGLLAIHPLLHMSRKDLWQLYMLGK